MTLFIWEGKTFLLLNSRTRCVFCTPISYTRRVSYSLCISYTRSPSAELSMKFAGSEGMVAENYHLSEVVLGSVS